MKEIPLSQGKVALVSDEDFEELSRWKWSATMNMNTHCQNATIEKWYAVRRERIKPGRRKVIYMHRFIMAATSGYIVDHLDGNGLNNTRENLVVGDHKHNNRNVPWWTKKQSE